ncbi:hypothetical protein JCM11641_001365 [Rhodosporidiobolus odoratus]
MTNVTWNGIDLAENRRKMEAGEFYVSCTPDLCEDRRVAAEACDAYNSMANKVPRRQQLKLLHKVFASLPELPPVKDDPEEDNAQLFGHLFCEPPLRIDYCDRIS